MFTSFPLTGWFLLRLIVSLLAILFFRWFVARIIRRWHYRLPPGPSGLRLPFLGQITTVDNISLWDHRDKYGDMSHVNVFGTDIIVLNSVQVIRDAFQGETASVFSSRPPTFIKRHLVSDDVVFRSIDDDNWKPLRQMFHSVLKTYGQGINEIENVVGTELDFVVDKLQAHIGETFNLEKYFESSLINILCILSIGKRFDSNEEIVQMLIESFKYGNRLADPSTDMVLRTFPSMRFLPFGPGSIVRRTHKCVDYTLGVLFREPNGLSEEDREMRKGIVFEMIKLRKKYPWMRDSHIVGVLKNIFAAGFLTTNASLRAFFLLMLHYPNVQLRLQSEIDDVVGRDRRPNLSDRQNMPYTAAAILELSRYTSILAMSIPHACATDTDFRGYTVPRDSVIIPNLFRVHHDAELWDSPWSYEPERFLDDSGHVISTNHQKRQNLIPFGVGKRLCIGEVFAKTRIFLYITYLLQAFTFKPAAYLPSCDPREFGRGIVLEPPSYSLSISSRY